MLNWNQCLRKYGPPEKEHNLILWDVPAALEIGAIPKKLYCNKDLVVPLHSAFQLLISRHLVAQLRTWDGCFNIRRKRGNSSPSLHSWAVAIDINAAWNQFGKQPTMSKELVACFLESGFEWGGTWRNPDGMHFQLIDV
jgi:hypothetical protein